ncbi:nucleoside triphosphate pyrophosphohydrolase family protein [Mucilaginibacter sp. ZT4R22]|uniref:Nucleoside triphosphate pyrophosphohydrolase family protein n=1 Tax=Mucilaginibacter pankratovii TaxID=2772110 RepID=A0ABR7WTB7_9SPHI|nr:nucleoside triphosphate pyrophosphohydrolase family protein [Mucilaginibacter pankratovii]MBD1365496.1 nucleoside triphosphate pyrophosphohydrolase family protein [Mucilaginibacter pankratovii]
MELNNYQELAKEHDQNSNRRILNSYIIPLFGIIGETGALISEFKKSFRDKSGHTKFLVNVEEILGNILWYSSNIATKMNLNLEDIANKNIQKIKERFPKPGEIICVTELFDSEYKDGEKIPRSMILEFREEIKNKKKKIKVLVDEKLVGDVLTDNSYDDDGYRYHDIFHFAYAAILGWSPVVRSIMGIKRKSNPLIDEIEDGARAAIIEEAISAFVYQFAKDHKFYENIEKVDNQLIKTIRNLSSNLEVSKCNIAEWEVAILMGYEVFRKLIKNGGGRVKVDLNNREIKFID